MNIGHQALAEYGLLHQDISANSVSLIKSGQFKGSLHDFDYSVYARERGQDNRIPRTVSRYIGNETCHMCLMRFREHVNSWPEIF